MDILKIGNRLIARTMIGHALVKVANIDTRKRFVEQRILKQIMHEGVPQQEAAEIVNELKEKL